MPRKPSVSPLNGVPTPPGFEAHPERRHHGAWKKEDSPRYKLEKMMQMTESELLEVAKDKKAPYFERKLAVCINKGDWKVVEGMLNQVLGTPKQQVETIDKKPKEIKIEVLRPVEAKGAKRTGKNSSKS